MADAGSVVNAVNIEGLLFASAPRILEGFEEFRSYPSLEAALGDTSRGDTLSQLPKAAMQAKRDVKQALWERLGPGGIAWITEDSTGQPLAFVREAPAQPAAAAAAKEAPAAGKAASASPKPTGSASASKAAARAAMSDDE